MIKLYKGAILGAGLLSTSLLALAQDAEQPDTTSANQEPAAPFAGVQPTPNGTRTSNADISPIILDSDNNSGATLGLDFEIHLTGSSKGPVAVNPNDPATARVGRPGNLSPFAWQSPIKHSYYDLLARGTLASSSTKTSNKLLDFAGEAGFEYDSRLAYFSGGLLLSHEIDQSRDNRQTMYGGTVSVSKVFNFSSPSVFQGAGLSLQAGYGTVDPSKDVEREKLLGTKPGKYKRWHGELSYSMNLPSKRVPKILFDYRRYHEVSAPQAIKEAGYDTHRLWYIKAFIRALDQNFFLAYSKGSLPFDQREVRAIKAGWSSDFMTPAKP